MLTMLDMNEIEAARFAATNSRLSVLGQTHQRPGRGLS